MSKQCVCKREMQEPIARHCLLGHQFYAETGTLTPCPLCLSRQVKMLREELEHLREEQPV